MIKRIVVLVASCALAGIMSVITTTSAQAAVPGPPTGGSSGSSMGSCSLTAFPPCLGIYELMRPIELPEL